MEPEDMTKLLLTHKTWGGHGLLLTDEWRKWFLDMETTPGEEVVKIVEMTAKHVEYYMN